MKARVRREDLLAACSLAIDVVPRKEIQPVLRNFRVEATSNQGGPGRLSIMGTDTEIGLRVNLDILEDLEPGVALIPARMLTDALRESRAEEIDLTSSPTSITLSGPRSRFEMQVAGHLAEFPEFPQGDTQKHTVVKASDLQWALARVVFCAAAKDGRYTMTGVLVHLEASQATFVATDSRHMGCASIAAQALAGHQTDGRTSIVPGRAMEVLSKCVQKSRLEASDESEGKKSRKKRSPLEDVRITFRASEVVFDAGPFALYSRLLEGRYPPYRAVLGQSSPNTFELPDGRELLSCLKQAAVMAGDAEKSVLLQFEALGVTISADSRGKSRVEMPCGYTGPAVNMSINPEFPIDMLARLPAETALVVAFKDEQSPLFLREGSNYIYMVMPIVKKEDAA